METVAFPLSVEDENVMAEKFLRDVRKYFSFEDDDFVNNYINELGRYLLKPLETKPFPFRFYIIRDNSLNAFAGPGGHIFIYSGLIEAVDELDELASVICHEIGHVSARHLARRIEQGKKIGYATMAGLLAGILIGGKAAGTIVSGSLAAGAQAQLHYSRDDERQADQLSFDYMIGAGFDPSGIIKVQQKLVKGQWYDLNRVPPYLLTHPGGAERMAHVDVLLADYSPPEEIKAPTIKFRTFFPFIKTILRARVMDPPQAEKLFNSDLEKDPESVSAHFGLGILCKERFEYAKAIKHFEKAIEGQPESMFILRHLGEVYQLKGDDRKAADILEGVLKTDERDKSALFLLAASYQNLEEYRKAILIYERLTSMKPVKKEVYYNLGVSYGRRDRLARAHYNFGLYFKMMNRIDKALFHFRKANGLSKNDSALRGRINEAMKDLLGGSRQSKKP